MTKFKMHDTIKINRQPQAASHGFTLMELLIVVSIIGILAAMVLPRYAPQTEKARISEAVRMLTAIREGEEGFFTTNGSYRTITSEATTATENDLWNQLGIQNPNSAPNPIFKYTVQSAGTQTFALARRSNSTYTNCCVALSLAQEIYAPSTAAFPAVCVPTATCTNGRHPLSP